MPDYAGSLLQVIDERVAAGARLQTKMGVVQSRDTTGARAMVALYGSSGAPQPVKCFEGVLVEAGDQVGLVKFESDWIIVGNYTLRTLGSAQMSLTFGSLTTTTTATYIDLPGSPVVSVLKTRDTTQLRIRIIMSFYTDANGTVFRIGNRIVNPDGAIDYDHDVFRFDINTPNAHHSAGGLSTTTGALPAGLYTLTGRWLRLSGTGNLKIDAQDQYHIEVDEVTL